MPITEERIRAVAEATLDHWPAGAAVLLFGSRARGDHRPTSDWDLAVVSDKGQDCPDGLPLSGLFALEPPVLDLTGISGAAIRHRQLQREQPVELDLPPGLPDMDVRYPLAQGTIVIHADGEFLRNALPDQPPGEPSVGEDPPEQLVMPVTEEIRVGRRRLAVFRLPGPVLSHDVSVLPFARSTRWFPGDRGYGIIARCQFMFCKYMWINHRT